MFSAPVLPALRNNLAFMCEASSSYKLLVFTVEHINPVRTSLPAHVAETFLARLTTDLDGRKSYVHGCLAILCFVLGTFSLPLRLCCVVLADVALRLVLKSAAICLRLAHCPDVLWRGEE